MTSATTADPAQHEPELAGQTVVVIGGSPGIGATYDIDGGQQFVS
jgi:hypothetical protein